MEENVNLCKYEQYEDIRWNLNSKPNSPKMQLLYLEK